MKLLQKLFGRKLISNPYGEGDFMVEYWGTHRVVRVPRSFSLLFNDDVYNHALLRQAIVLKQYVDDYHDEVALVKDKYGRLWLRVYWEESFDDRIEEVFDLVNSEEEADERYENTGGGPRYSGSLPHFFASENYDFILHEEVEKSGNPNQEMQDILLLNKNGRK